jgi:phosphoribosylformylglycinamidine cyclo-ligase
LFERHDVEDFVDELNMRLGDALLAIHRSYLNVIRSVSEFPDTHAFAHITGGGIIGNTRRVMPDGLTLHIEWKRWERPPIFRLLQQYGNVPENDMRRTFNLGVGLVIVAGKRGAERIMRTLQQQGEKAFLIGEVVKQRQ